MFLLLWLLYCYPQMVARTLLIVILTCVTPLVWIRNANCCILRSWCRHLLLHTNHVAWCTTANAYADFLHSHWTPQLKFILVNLVSWNIHNTGQFLRETVSQYCNKILIGSSASGLEGLPAKLGTNRLYSYWHR